MTVKPFIRISFNPDFMYRFTNREFDFSLQGLTGIEYILVLSINLKM